MLGLYNVYKNVGVTSNKVVMDVKKATNCKAGHFGTLDPLAEGVLPIAVGKATRLFDYLVNKRKTYIAEFTFGMTTDTLDREGVVTDKCSNIPTKSAILEALPDFVGEIMQVPPQYSALSIGGVRSYKRARNGQETQLQARPVTVHALRLTDCIDERTYRFEIECGKGTYIRALARDVAISCGTVGYMSALKRTASGPFCASDSVTVEQIRANPQSCLMSIEQVLPYERMDIADEYYAKLVNGVRIPLTGAVDTDAKYLLYCRGALFGVARIECGKIVLECNLLDEAI